MAADPSIMLMDEPFAAIDNITRRRLQDELIRIQSLVRKTVLFVTHYIEEAIRLADKIAVMRLARSCSTTPAEYLSNPADDFVADLVGSEDVLRRLSLLDVQSIMTPLADGAALDPNAPRTAGRHDSARRPWHHTLGRCQYPDHSRRGGPAGGHARPRLRSGELHTGTDK